MRKFVAHEISRKGYGNPFVCVIADNPQEVCNVLNERELITPADFPLFVRVFNVQMAAGVITATQRAHWNL